MDSANQLISVIVPIYNAQRHLPQCVGSLLAQTDPDWELLLIDDGSTDGSQALCQAFRAKDPRVRLYRQENAGVSAARNLGMAHAQGEYFCFVDADDWVEPDYLAVLRRTLSDTQMALCGVDCGEEEALSPGRLPVSALRAAPSRYARNVYLNCPCNRLYRRQIVTRFGLSMPVGVKRGEDALFVASYLSHCDTVAVTDRVLYHYRANEGSAMHRFYEAVCRDETMVMQCQYELFHPAGPQSLCREEETAYRVWEFGKVLSVCRYLGQYAGGKAQAKAHIRRWLEEPVVRQCLAHAPGALGKKAPALRTLARLGLWDLCAGLLLRLA